MDAPVKTPVLEGWFTLDEREPHLLGARCAACGTYYFPKAIKFCRHPDCAGETFEEVKLSRTGRIWSYTNAAYKPPEPYISNDPFVPYGIAAVELEQERMIVLGQVASGVGVEALKVGMQVELILEPLDDGKLSWKWKPVQGPAAEGSRPPSLSRTAGEGRADRGAIGGVRGDPTAPGPQSVTIHSVGARPENKP